MPIEHIQQRWHFHQRMNKKVWININRLRMIALSSESKQDVLDAMHPWRLSLSLRYNNSMSYLLISVGVIILFASTIYLYQAGITLLILWLIALAIIAYGYLSIDKQSEVDAVIHLLQDLVFQSQYNIQLLEFPNIAQNTTINPTYMLMKIRQSFPCFNEGNSNNEFRTFAATTWHIDGHDYPILLLHYVATDEIVMRDQKGREYRKQIETHRFGACVFHMPPLALVVSSERESYERYPVRWRTSDIRLNQRLHIYGQQEFELAKNLNPQRVIALADSLAHMKGRLIFHEDMQAMCYISTQPIFECKKPRKEISDVSQLRGYLRTLQAPHYENMQKNLSTIIRSFKDENLLS